MQSEGEIKLVAGRACGSCSLCCKVFTVDWLDKPKPAGKWCHHCAPGKGCAIWQNVPERCASFFCDWRTNAQLGDEWRPDRAGFVIFHQAERRIFEITVDPGKPDAWRRKPYSEALRQVAERLVGDGQTMIVRLGALQWVLLPDGEAEIPPEHRSSGIRITRDSPVFGGRWRVEFIPRPRFG